ncbi:MAG: MBOAT family protein [Parasporobacterium sp.]|nr:MBOAT family protein [Parasporobacterium sp.]
MNVLLAFLNGLQYNTPQFIFFLIVFCAVFFAVPKNWMKVTVIILGNLVFYRYVGGINQLALVIGISLIVYIFSLLLQRIYNQAEKEKPADLGLKQELEFWNNYKKKTRILLIIGIILVISLLIYTKVGRLMSFEQVAFFSQWSFGKVLVPLGLSYFTFSSIGYLIDIYKRKTTAEKNYALLFACVTFFPIIVQGPISRYDRLMEQFRNIPRFDYIRFCSGMQRMLWGLFKKMVLADSIMPGTGIVFTDVFSYSGIEILLSLIMFVTAFYADFSGCMDIVIGVAEAMGIQLSENFRQPLLSPNITEFWRRWHITLLTWFRDYIYMPMAKSSAIKKLTKKSKNALGKHIGTTLVMAIPVLVVWLITALWHGTGADYLVWGVYWAVLTILSMLLQPVFDKISTRLHIRTESFGWRILSILRTDFCYMVSVMFIASSATYGLKGFIYLAKQAFMVVPQGQFLTRIGLNYIRLIPVCIAVILLAIVDIMSSRGINIRQVIARRPLVLRWIIWFSLIFILLVFGIYGPEYSAAEFVYRGF